MRKMACTTILVGKKASYDGSTMIARNDDSGSGHFTAKKFVVVTPEEQPKTMFPCSPCESRTSGTGDALYIHAKCKKKEKASGQQAVSMRQM